MRIFPATCNACGIFETLAPLLGDCERSAQIALCGALPVLATWDTTNFCAGTQIDEMVEFMLSLPVDIEAHAMRGLGQLSGVVLDR
jgi:hypothetical protein